MTTQKDLKRLVRARMEKTGESYTAARAQIIRKPKSKNAEKPAAADYAALAGMSDDAVKAKTGCGWAKWVKSLDHYGAEKMSHAQIAKLVHEKYGVGSWWTQTVAVGYERIKGLRARGQRRNGTYEATKSRTFNVPVETLYDAFADARRRKRWLDGVAVKVRTATRPRSIRLDWPGGGIVAVGFFAKGKAKAQVALSHAKLADRETANRIKQEWSGHLDALGEMIAER